MTTEKISSEIWTEILKYGGKLSYEERAALVVAIEDILESNQQSAPYFDRLMALEIRVLGQEDSVNSLSSNATIFDHMLIKLRGQISELTEQLKELRGKYETLESQNTLITGILVNQATETIKELTDNRIVGEYE